MGILNDCCAPPQDMPKPGIGSPTKDGRRKFVAFAELQKLLDSLGQDNLGLYKPSTLTLPANAEVYGNYRGNQRMDMKNGVGKQYEMNQAISSSNDHKEMKMQFGNYVNDELDGYGMEVIAQDNPDRRMFSLFIGEFKMGNKLSGFYIKALNKKENEKAKNQFHYFKGTFDENGFLKSGFRKEMQGFFNEYEGSFVENKFNGKAKTRIVAFAQECQFQLYEGEYKNSRKHGMGKLTIFKDIKSKDRIKFEQERSKKITQLIDSTKFHFDLVLQLLREISNENFDSSIPASATVTTIIEVPWIEGKANGVGEEYKPQEGIRYLGMFKQNQKCGYGEETKGDQIRKGFFYNGQLKKSEDTEGEMEYYKGGTQTNGQFKRECKPKGK